MRTNIVFTLTGTDRIGLVNDLTELLLALDGNVEASRMARLGGGPRLQPGKYCSIC